MADETDTSYETRVETNRWESLTRLTFVYFADEDYEVTQEFDQETGNYTITFVDEDRDETAVFVYDGGPPDMAKESLQGMQMLFQETTNVSEMWMDMLDSASSR